MTNEFHTLDGTCSDLVPSGDGYEGVSLANQVCPTIGSEVGRSTVSGTQFVAVSFGYYQSHLWRVSDFFTLTFYLDNVLIYHTELRHRYCLWYCLPDRSLNFHGVQYWFCGRERRCIVQGWVKSCCIRRCRGGSRKRRRERPGGCSCIRTC